MAPGIHLVRRNRPCPTTLIRPSRGRTASSTSTILYVFSGVGGTVFIMDVNSTITGPDVQRGFHPEARYEFKVHFDGAAFETLTYRVSFGEGDAGGGRPSGCTLSPVTTPARTPPPATRARRPDWRTGQLRAACGSRPARPPNLLRRPVAARSRRGGEDGTAGTCRGGVPRAPEQLHRHHRRDDRARGLPPAPAAARRCAYGVWCATKLATDAGGWRQIHARATPDVADLLARRHSFCYPR